MNKSKNELFVVGIGASAGGLDAIQRIFDNLPNDTGLSFIIVQHLSPDFKSLMPELLSKHTKMKIFKANDKQVIQPNCIYLNQRSKNLQIKGNQLRLIDRPAKPNLNLPINIFFHSLGQEYSNRAIGIILSGTGSDGSKGIETIKNAGGTIFVQDSESAQFDGMPNSAIATEMADEVLSPENIATALAKINRSRQFTTSIQLSNSENSIFSNIIEEIQRSSGIDFRQYRESTLLRRIYKCMNMNQIQQLEDYLELLKREPNERQLLKQSFLLSVTEFFRDSQAFEALKIKALPELISHKKNNETIRIWVPGCATGEEAYSIAILIDEYLRQQKLKLDYKIFATDVDTRALNKASIGSYLIKDDTNFKETYFNNYFIKSGKKIKIIKRIRERVVFSKHDLLKEPPFIRLDLISCRNLLIYLETNVQKRIMMNFQFALNKFGVLFLGSSESVGEFSKYFKIVDSKWKIYQNIHDTELIKHQINPEERMRTFNFRNSIQTVIQPDHRPKENPDTAFYKYLSDRFSPACIFFDEEFNILFIKGDAGKRLTLQEGFFQSNLLKMVSTELVTILKNGVRKCNQKNDTVRFKNIVNKTKEGTSAFDLVFHKIPEAAGLPAGYMIRFDEDKLIDEKTVKINHGKMDELSRERIEALENDLESHETELQNMTEELEVSNEELQSSNEELVASNEELQSTNEELQSANEELYTVNAELQQSNKELLDLNNDVNNLLNSTEIGTLFLDSNLLIRKFTPAIQKHFKLNENDIGRPITSFAANFDESVRQLLIEDSEKILTDLRIIEREVVDDDGNMFLQRIGPFVTADHKIEGVVITLVDINALKQAEAESEKNEANLTALIENTSDMIWSIDTDYCLLTANTTFLEYVKPLYGHKPSIGFCLLEPDLLGADLYEKWKQSYDRALSGEQFNLEFETVTHPKTKCYLDVNYNPIYNDEHEIIGVSVFARDITEKKQATKQIALEREKLLSILNGLDENIYIADPETYEILFVNDAMTNVWGKDIVGKKCYKIFQNLDKPCEFCTNEIIFKNRGKTHRWEFQNKLSQRWYRCYDKAIQWTEHKWVRFELATDITELVQANHAAKEREKEMAGLYALSQLSHDNLNLDAICETLAHKIIPQSMQFPEKVWVQLEMGKTYRNIKNLKPDDYPNSISVPISNQEREYGCLTVGYIDNSPFLEYYEQRLIDSYALNLAKIYEKNEADKKLIQSLRSLDESNKKLKAINFQLKKSEQAIRESEKKFHGMIQNLLEGFYSVTPEGKVLNYNAEFVNILGLDPAKDHTGSKTPDFWQHQSERETYLEALMTRGFIKNYAVNIKRANGEKAIVQLNSRLFRDESGNPLRIEGTFLDVTQLKEAEAALKESEDNLRLMFEMMPIGWAEHRMVFNADGEPQDYIFLDANPAFELFTGLERKKIIGKPVTEVISEIRTAKPDLIAIYGEVVRSGKEKTFDLYFQPFKRWYRVTAFKRDEARFVVMFEENTDRKKAEDNLFESEERYRLAIEAAENGIYDWQIESNDIYFSDQWKAQLGYQPDELVNEFETWEKLLHPDDRQDIMQKVMDFIQNPSEFFFAEYQMEHKDGSYRWMQNKAKAFRDNNEKVVRMFGAHTDINERKKAEITIKKQLEEIKSINKKLENYSYSISHDLKEPIRSIRSFSEFIQEDYADQFDEEARDYFDRIIKASTKMAVMIDDLLMLSRVGRTDIEFRQVPVSKLINEVKDILRQKIDEKNVSINHNKLPKITCQPIWIKAVFQNLISNSIKYSDKDKTIIEIIYRELPKFHEFSIKDNGVGIQEAQHDKIFGLFRKAHQDRNTEGSGAGLAIVSSVMEQHHGKIWVDWSQPGEGTVMKFTIHKDLNLIKEAAA